MQISGLKNCPKCGTENKLITLFTSAYYDDCKNCSSGAEKKNSSFPKLYNSIPLNKDGSFKVAIPYKKGDKAICGNLIGMIGMKIKDRFGATYIIADKKDIGRESMAHSHNLPVKTIANSGCYIQDSLKVTILENPRGWVKV